MNILQKLAQRILFILLAIQLTACSPQDNAMPTMGDKKNPTAQCLSQQSQCKFDLVGGQVQVLFDVDKIVAEQSFNMVVHYQGAETLTNITGYLEGVDMFMGKIPLFIEAHEPDKMINDNALADVKPPANTMTPLNKNIKQVFHAEVLVGSCSAEQMTWRIWLTFTTSEDKNYSKMLTVVSYRS